MRLYFIFLHKKKDFKIISALRHIFFVERRQEYRCKKIAMLGEFGCQSVFAQKSSRRGGICCTDYSLGEEQTKPLLYNSRTITLYDNAVVPLLNCEQPYWRTSTALGQVYSQSGLTAVARVNNADMHSRVTAYVAAGKAFSLFQFHILAIPIFTLPQELIAFANPAESNKITHMQCLHSHNNDRSGVVVRRSDGSIELWEDRQPKSPAVVYKSPPRGPSLCSGPPVVDTPSHSYLAAPLNNCRAVGVWRLQTGELLNILEIPGYMLRRSSDYYPIALVMRSRWGWGGSSWPFCGPVLLAIQGRFVNFFY